MTILGQNGLAFKYTLPAAQQTLRSRIGGVSMVYDDDDVDDGDIVDHRR